MSLRLEQAAGVGHQGLTPHFSRVSYLRSLRPQAGLELELEPLRRDRRERGCRRAWRSEPGPPAEGVLVRKGTGHPLPSAESPGPALWVMVTADSAGRASDQTAPPRWETKVPGVSVLSMGPSASTAVTAAISNLWSHTQETVTPVCLGPWAGTSRPQRKDWVQSGRATEGQWLPGAPSPETTQMLMLS